jgi:hypothetical protein
MSAPLTRRHFTFETTLKASPSLVFPLLCPVREYEWIEHWRCELLHSVSGVAEPGCVFRTEFPDSWGPEVWVVSHYEPCERIAFVRTGGLRAMRYAISLRPKGEGTRILWHQEITSLNAEGDALLRSDTREAFDAEMRHLNFLLEHFLVNETMYRDGAS